MTASAHAIAKALGDAGYNRAAVAGIVGNLMQESRFNPTAVGDKGTAIGIAQWRNERADALRRFARNRGSGWQDNGTQVEFLKHEIETQYPGLRERLNSAASPEEAARVFAAKYERPARIESSRGEYARQYFETGQTPKGGSVRDILSRVAGGLRRLSPISEARAEDVEIGPKPVMKYTREQVYKALKAADAAGDVEAARKIASGWKSMQAGSPQASKSGAPGVKTPEKSESAPAAPKTAQKQSLVSGATGEWEKPSGVESLGMGLADPVHGGAQALVHSLPEDVVSGVNRAAEAVGIPGGTAESIDKQIAERESAYQARRGPNAGIDWLRLLGNIGTGIPVAAAVPGGPVVSSTLAGAAQGALAPVTEGDYGARKALDVGLGAAGGLAGGAAVKGVSRMIAPKASVDPNIQTLKEAGVPMTPGQVMGGIANKIEQRSTSIPMTGDIISSARQRGVNALNRAAYDRALAPIGQKSTADLGRDAVAEVERKLSGAYDDLADRIRFRADDGLAAKLAELRSMATELPEPQAKRFEQVVDQIVMKRLDTKTQTADGRTFKTIQEKLRDLSRGYKGSGDPDQRNLGHAIDEVQNALNDNLARVNPEHAQELSAINSGWRHYAIIRDAAGRIGADEGVFTSAQLQSAVRSSDKSVGKGRFARGQATMQDLSEAGKTVLGSTVPNSGTPERVMSANLLGLGTGAVTAPLAAVLYSSPSEYLITALMARRPEALKAIAPALRGGEQLSPYIAPELVGALMQQYGISGQ